MRYDTDILLQDETGAREQLDLDRQPILRDQTENRLLQVGQRGHRSMSALGRLYRA